MIRLGSLVESVETELLGREGLSFSQASTVSRWEPEPPDLACWRCAGTIGAFESDGDGCARCRDLAVPWDRAVRLGQYDGIIRDAVLDLKFRRWRLTGMQLGRAMGSEIQSRLASLDWNPAEVRFVPIPMTHRRRILRGVHHARVLARGASSSTGIRCVELLGARSRPEQIGLTATERAKNIRGGFFVHETRLKPLSSLSSPIRALILVDDVRTTGATMNEGCRVLRRALVNLFDGGTVEIWSLNAAVAGNDRRDLG